MGLVPWQAAAEKLPRDVRDTFYDAYIQGLRLKEAGWAAEKLKADGLKEFLVVPARTIWREHRELIELAFWDGFNGATDLMKDARKAAAARAAKPASPKKT
jgi:hypothetical protein